MQTGELVIGDQVTRGQGEVVAQYRILRNIPGRRRRATEVIFEVRWQDGSVRLHAAAELRPLHGPLPAAPACVAAGLPAAPAAAQAERPVSHSPPDCDPFHDRETISGGDIDRPDDTAPAPPAAAQAGAPVPPPGPPLPLSDQPPAGL
jgi:hypothetical protein